jgi:hypothetical protein
MVNTQIKWPHQPNAAILIYNQKKTNAPRDFWIKTDDESRLKCVHKRATSSSVDCWLYTV